MLNTDSYVRYSAALGIKAGTEEKKDLLAPLGEPGPEVPTPQDAALEREDRELLYRALTEIPETHRETLVLFYLQG